tara:strand:- start:8560 stop:9726 length:1167 start_codon:yes stop_codon:yes gene_type:complete
MRISKRQLRKIIKESLSLQNEERRKGIPKALNFRRIRIDLDKFKKDLCNEELYNIIRQHEEDLKDKVEGGESKLMKGRFREAESLLEVLTNWLKKADDKCNTELEKGDVTKKATKKKKPPEVDPDPWKPDPDEDSEWEYQLRNCIWYARKKDTKGKGVKLGPAKSTYGKYRKAIAILDKEYSGEIESCKAPTKPKKKDPRENTVVPPEADPVVNEPTTQEKGEFMQFEIIQLLADCANYYQQLKDTSVKVNGKTRGGGDLSNIFANSSDKILNGTYTASVGSVRDRFSVYKGMGSSKAFTKIFTDYNIRGDLDKVYYGLVGTGKSATKIGTIKQCKNMAEMGSYEKQKYSELAGNFQRIANALDPKIDKLEKFTDDNRSKKPGGFKVT